MGCGLPADDFPVTGGEDCASCAAFLACDEFGHGRFFFGDSVNGDGFRTDRCIRDWAKASIAYAAQEADWWLRKGSLETYAGESSRLPAVLVDAVLMFDDHLERAWEDERAEKRREYEDDLREQGFEIQVMRRKSDG